MKTKTIIIIIIIILTIIIIIITIILIIIIIIIVFIMIVIIYLIRLFREIRCIQPKSRVSSLIPSLKFLFPLSPRNPYCPFLWNATLVSVNVNYSGAPRARFAHAWAEPHC